ncbi:MAG: hypothetical protein HKN60_10035 [Rhizobiales bacterium]|nr:hypothetical protein [Hyphomicrobiales bacterium]
MKSKWDLTTKQSGAKSAAMVISACLGAAMIFALTDPVRSSSHLMGHITIETPGQLTPDEASEVYQELADKMARGYADTGYAIVRDYQNWTLYNTSPYLSATHGNRYVNNYANDKAIGYERVGDGVVMPEGAVFAKDSFTVTDEDQLLPAPLFVMEKLAAGKSPDTADWRYVSILPDGTVFGDSQGASADRTIFCHECHIAVAEDDYLFYVPEEFRASE